jgi:hypothetical protein
MQRLLFCGSLLALCLWTTSALVPGIRADDKSQKKDTKKDSDSKTLTVKRAQASTVSTLQGMLKGVDDASFILVRQLRGQKQETELILAEDVAVRATPEPEFDSKGKPKPFKPDPSDQDRKVFSVATVKAGKSDLHDNQQVWVVVGKWRNKLVAKAVLIMPEKK